MPEIFIFPWIERPGPYNTVRRRDRLRTLDDFYESFSVWYAFALGYNGLEEMEQNKKSDDDVRLNLGLKALFDSARTK